MTTPFLFGDEGAATPGSNRRTESHPEDNTARVRMVPPARRNAPQGTSDAAAASMIVPATEQRAAVLAVIVNAGASGATDAEIEAATGIRAQSVSPRRGELRTLGLIVDSGRRRPTPSGRTAAVWVTPNHAPKSTPKSMEQINGKGAA